MLVVRKWTQSHPYLVRFLIVWLLFVVYDSAQQPDVLNYAGFSFLGVLGAIFANSTGAGGGVIFIPFFNQLNFTQEQAIATSFAIQCFGMTAGAYTWWCHYKTEKQDLRLWHGFRRIIVITTIFSIIGLWLVYLGYINNIDNLPYGFSWFSLILGFAILLMAYVLKPKRERSQISQFDYVMLIAIGLGGGMITAWLSVGVGEILAIYLIVRRFDVTMAVSAAVIVSAFTVWAGIWYHTLIDYQVYDQVLLFACAGAVIGGVLAKWLVTLLSARKLKVFFSVWLLISGGVGVFASI